MSRKTIGALIGLLGAQALTLVLFLAFSEPCECIAGICTGAECLWGKTIGEYWATYGLGGTVAATVLGYLIAEG